MTKAFTDIEQSKKLSEILPVESADMWWSKNFIYYNPTAIIGIGTEYNNVYTYKFGEDDIPCWSLAALLQMLPYCIGGKYGLMLGKLAGDDGWYVCYGDENNVDKHYVVNSNLLDACVEMIYKLKENNLL